MSLTIRSSFEIAAPRAQAWAVLTDIERAAPCFPGATLTGRREDGTWKGAFNVKLGPMSFKFGGAFGFIALDEAEGRATVKADGTDVKGRGGANARVEMHVLPITAQSTRVELVSSVDLSGGVAQYGRGAGMIEALSQQLIDQFARNLGVAIAATSPVRSIAGDAPGADSASGAISPMPAPMAATAPAPAATLDAGSLVWRALMATIRRWFGLRQSH